MSRYDYRFRLNIPLRPDTTGPQILERLAPVWEEIPSTLKKILMAFPDSGAGYIDEGNGFLEWNPRPAWNPKAGELVLKIQSDAKYLRDFAGQLRPFMESMTPLAVDS